LQPPITSHFFTESTAGQFCCATALPVKNETRASSEEAKSRLIDQTLLGKVVVENIDPDSADKL
jgi:hypothetical protein